MPGTDSSNAHRDYSGTPLIRKLGIVSAKSSLSSVALLHEPPDFRELLGECPPDVKFTTRITPATKLVIAFVYVLGDVASLADLLAGQLPEGAHAWICWPKSSLKPGFNGDQVREAGLTRGLVDYKVCSINEDWSALKFARSKS